MSMRHLIAGALFLAAAAASEASARTLTIATAEGSTAGSAAKELAGVLAHLNSSSDLKYTLKTYPTYDATYEAFKRGEAELMLVGSVKYVQAHSELGAVPVVVEEPRWQESVVIVPKSSPLKSVAELKGKKFAFGYDDSTTTHLLPLLLLLPSALHAATLDDEVPAFLNVAAVSGREGPAADFIAGRQRGLAGAEREGGRCQRPEEAGVEAFVADAEGRREVRDRHARRRLVDEEARDELAVTRARAGVRRHRRARTGRARERHLEIAGRGGGERKSEKEGEEEKSPQHEVIGSVDPMIEVARRVVERHGSGARRNANDALPAAPAC